MHTELAAAAEELGILFAHNPVPMWVFDPGTLRILAVNQAAERQYGYSADEFLSLTLADIRPPGEMERVYAAVHDPRGGGVLVRGEFRHRRRDGSLLDVEITTQEVPFRGATARVAMAVDVTGRRRAVQRLEALHAVTARLATALTPGEVAQAVVSEGVAALGARSGAVALLDAARGELHVVQAVGYPPEAMERFRSMPLATDFPLAEAVRLAEPIFLADAAARAERYPALADLRRANGGGAMAAVPLLAGGAPIGCIGLNFPEGFVLGDEERAFVLSLAGQCAQAMHRAGLYEEERHSRMAAERLQALTEGFSGAATEAQVGAVAMRQGVAALGAYAGVLALRTEEGDELELLSSIGYPEEACMSVGRRWRMDASIPIAEATRTGEPVFLESPRAWAAHFGGGYTPPASSASQAWAAVPVALEDGGRGALLWTYDRPRRFDPRERALMLSISRLCAQGLDRARLFEAERRARAEAERLAVALDGAREAAEMESRRLATVLDAIPIGVWMADATGRVTDVNRAAPDIWGEAPMSAGVQEYAAYRARWPETGQPVQPEEWALARAVSRGEVVVGERVEIERLDGSRGFILNSGAPIRDADGTIVGGVVAALDVTERMRAEAERDRALAQAEAVRDRLRLVFEQAPVAIVLLRGPEHLVESANARYVRLLGPVRRAAQLLGLPVRRALPELAGQGFFELLDRVYATGEPFVGTEVPARLDRDGDGVAEEALYNFVYQPLFAADGAVEGICAIGVDVTDLVQGRRAAEEANLAKSQFLATMSHELRTPLNAIGGYAQLLEMGIFGPVTEPQRAQLSRIQRSQEHLLGLINSVLNFARIEAGRVQYTLEEVPVAPALAEVVEFVLPQAGERGVAVEAVRCEAGLRVRADAEKLRQVMLNLLSNAVKFTPEGGSISVWADARPDGLAAVRVRDTGVGIAPDRIGDIFDPFVQVGRRLNSRDEGVGLGLAISRDLARGMGGDLTVESAPGHGATFTFTLPLADG
jgi:PAS domain S-box-containing protein